MVKCSADLMAGAIGQDDTHLTMREEPADLDRAARSNDLREDERTSTRPTVEEMGEWSFPASDPPATWTWDVEVPRGRDSDA